jgi:hypothetical protein
VQRKKINKINLIGMIFKRAVKKWMPAESIFLQLLSAPLRVCAKTFFGVPYQSHAVERSTRRFS